MKKTSFILGFLTLLLISGCVKEVEKDYGKKDFPSMYSQQIQQSCLPGAVVIKKIAQLDGMGYPESEEEHRFTLLSCSSDSAGQKIEGRAKMETGEEVDFSLQDELDYAFKYFYLDPYLLPFFEVTESAGTFEARIKSGESDETPLHYQKIQLVPGYEDRLMYVESGQGKESIFNDQSISMWVNFSKNGLLESATLILNMELSLSQDEASTSITYEMDYSEVGQ